MKPLIINRLQIFIEIKLDSHKKCRRTPKYNVKPVELTFLKILLKTLREKAKAVDNLSGIRPAIITKNQEQINGPDAHRNRRRTSEHKLAQRKFQ